MPKIQTPSTPSEPPELRVLGLCKRFAGREVLTGADLHIQAGTAAALLGKNGSGKSTLLNIVAGIIEPESGTVTWNGQSLLEPSGRAHVGYVPEAADAPPFLLAGEFLTLIASLRKSEWPSEDLLDTLGVSMLLNQQIGSLSLGQRRRTCIAAALTGAPSLLLLDEPTNGLDPAGVEMLSGVLREHLSPSQGHSSPGAALIATHDLHFADSIGARRLRLCDGKVTSA